MYTIHALPCCLGLLLLRCLCDSCQVSVSSRACGGEEICLVQVWTKQEAGEIN